MNDKKKIGEIKKIFDELEEGKLIPILEEIKKIVERYDTSGPQYLIDRIRETSETIIGTSEDKKKIEEVLQLMHDEAWMDNPDMTRLVKRAKKILEK